MSSGILGTTPRCGRPVLAYSIAGRPYDPEPVCGRKLGHKGPCLSRQAWRRELDRASRRDRGRYR